MSSKKRGGGGRQYSGAAPSMRNTSGSNKKSQAKKGGKKSTGAASGRVRPARAQNAYSAGGDDDDDGDSRHAHMYDREAHASREYKLPDNFEDEELDSDEEGIFDEADEEKYGDVFASKSKAKGKTAAAAKKKGKKSSASHASTEDDEMDEEDDDLGLDDEEEDEDLTGFEGAETMNLSDMIGMEDTSYGEDEKTANKKGKKEKVSQVKLTKQQQRMLEEAEEDEEEADGDDQEPGEEGEDEEVEDEDDEQLSVDEDEDMDESANGDAHKSLLNFVTGLKGVDESAPAAGKSDKFKKKKGLVERTEAFDEDQFSIPRLAGESSLASSGLKLGDLLRKLPGVSKSSTAGSGEQVGDSSNIAALKKQFQVLQSQHTATLLEPLPEIRQDELTRIASYQATKEDIVKWTPLINRNRDATSLSFPLNAPPRQNLSTAEMQTRFKPSQEQSLEKDLSTLLSTYGLKEDQLAKSETQELEKRGYTPEELAKREEQLGRMKSLLFYQELKAKRLAKIKSKSYRRLQKKLKEKKKLTMEEMKELDPESYEAEQRKAEMRRIEERMSLNHSANSKWLKSQLRVNEQMKGSNTELKDALKTHQATAAALKQKQESFPKERHSSDQDEDDSEDEASDAAEREQYLNEMFNGSDGDDEEDDEDGEDSAERHELRAQKASESRAASIRAKLKELEASLGSSEAEQQEPVDGFAVAPGTKKGASAAAAAAGKGERILGLKFMQKALEKKREETRAAIREYEAELEHELKREELRRQNRREGKEVMDNEELDAVIAAETAGEEDSKLSSSITIGRKKIDPKSVANVTLVKGVGEDAIKLLPHSLQTSTKGSATKSATSQGIKVAAPKQSAASIKVAEEKAAAEAAQLAHLHPGQHHLIHGKSSLKVDTPFPVVKPEDAKLFATEEFSEDEEEEKKSTSDINTKFIDLQKIKHDSRSAQQAARRAAGQAVKVAASGPVATTTSKNGKKAKPESKSQVEESEDDDLDEADEPTEEANPWFATSTANPRKALRATDAAARSKKKQKTEKGVTFLKPGGEDDDEEDEEDETPSSGPLKLRAKRSEFDLLNNGSLSQSELVRMAFSNAEEDTLMKDGEEGEDDFERMKREAMEEDLPKEEKSTAGLPGWGQWGGIGTTQRKSAAALHKEAAEKHAREVRRLAAISARKDAKLKHVLINEKVDQKALKYQVATLPYPFTSQEQYEKSLMTPIGKEWNTTASFQANVLPKVITKAGEIIDPIKFNPKVGAAGKKKDLSDKEPKKISGGAQVGQKRKR